MRDNISAAELKKLLRLEPHPREGGWFRQTWRSEEAIPQVALPARYATAGLAGRAAGTAIYYLLEPDNFSEMHRLVSDEVFHFYLGDAVEMLQLYSDKTGQRMVLGSNLLAGELLQTVVPQGVWQGSRLIAGGEFALLGCTVSPGFDYADYASAEREPLVQQWPEWADMIACLTRR